MAQGKTVVFIDASVANQDTILAGIGKDTAVVLLDSHRDGLLQIAETLSSYQNLAAVHIVSHGNVGQLVLGNAIVGSSNIDGYQTALATVGRSLSATGDILLYGCNVGQGNSGQAFIDQLARYTGADVAASTDATGSLLSGGDWALEASSGRINASNLDLGGTYAGTLGIINGTSGDDYLIATDGNDTINGGGNGQYGDRVDYGNSKSAVNVNLTTGTATGGSGADTLIGIEHVTGSRFNDTLKGNGETNWFNPGAGNDTVDGAAGDDTVMYNESSSGVTVNLKTGTASGAGIGSDRLTSIENAHGTLFNDVITLSDTGGHVFGRAGNDLLTSGKAGGYFIGGSGADTIEGAGSWDTVSYEDDGYDGGTAAVTGKGVTVNLLTGTATDNWGHKDVLRNIENVNGSRFNDVITLSNSGGYASGGDGNDLLLGREGADRFSGGNGNDTIDGGVINDHINYTDANTVTYSSSTSGVNVNLATGKAYDGLGGIDKLTSINFVTGSSHDDVLTGSTALLFELFNGGAGDDVINGGAVTDRINQRNANRVTYQDATSAVIVNLGEGIASGGGGNDVLANINQLFGSAFDDILIGSDSDLSEQFDGLAGNDIIDGGEGIDAVRYGRALSAVTVNLATGVAQDGYGTVDTLMNIEGARGSSFNDILIGGNTDNGTGTIDGLEYFVGELGNDTINGGAGYDRADYITSTAGVVVTLGGTGIGTAQDGLGGIDKLINIEGVRASAFNDTLTGSDSGVFESFEGREGNDVINGKGGVDRADYERSTGGITVDLNTGIGYDGYGGTDTLLNIENVRGSLAFDDRITGNASANLLEGLGGNDTLNGLAGADTMIGGDGNDTYTVDNARDIVTETNAILSRGGNDLVNSSVSYTLGANVENLRLNSSAAINGTGNALNNIIYAGAGNNVLNGGAGIDTASYAHSSTGVKVSLATTAAQATGGSGTDTLIGFENLSGSGYQDTLSGNGVSNILDGGAGADVLNGDAGNDTLIGGAGNDTLNGGAGQDKFVFNAAVSATANVDTIVGFVVADDTICLENAIFKKLTATGTLNAANFKVLGTTAIDANDYILYNGSTGALSYDADGSGAGAAIQIALVGKGLNLANLDFEVI